MQYAVENTFVELPLMWATHANCNCKQQADLDTVEAYAKLHKSTTTKLDMGVRAGENVCFLCHEEEGGMGMCYLIWKLNMLMKC